MKKFIVAFIIGYYLRAVQKSFFWRALKRRSLEKLVEALETKVEPAQKLSAQGNASAWAEENRRRRAAWVEENRRRRAAVDSEVRG